MSMLNYVLVWRRPVPAATMGLQDGELSVVKAAASPVKRSSIPVALMIMFEAIQLSTKGDGSDLILAKSQPPPLQ